MNHPQEFGKVAVLMGGRAGLGVAERGCGQAKQAPRAQEQQGKQA